MWLNHSCKGHTYIADAVYSVGIHPNLKVFLLTGLEYHSSRLIFDIAKNINNMKSRKIMIPKIHIHCKVNFTVIDES